MSRAVSCQARLLLVLYLSFISLGLPDSILGVSWPVLRFSFDKPLYYGGFLVSITTIISVLSSLAAPWVMARLGTGVIIAACALMTATAMFGYAFSPVWVVLIGFTVLFGIGQGAVDTAVNSYMARSYSSRHMNWVHACWGIGATSGPLIMSTALGLQFSWRAGYMAIGIIQCLLALIFFRALPLWRKCNESATGYAHGASAAEQPRRELHGRRLGVTSASGVLFYFLYPGIEYVGGFWSASYLVEKLGASPAMAGAGVTLYWGALTVGRITTGIIAAHLRNSTIIRLGIALAVCGIFGVILSAAPWQCIASLCLIGLGLSPLHPTMMHDTPRRIGAAAADRLVGFQVGAAMAGKAVIPLLIGLLAAWAVHAGVSWAGAAPARSLVARLFAGWQRLILRVAFKRKLLKQRPYVCKY